MAIGRTEDRNTPGNPLGRRPHRDVWGPIRVTHLGPRSTWPHIRAGHMTAIDQTRRNCKKSLRSGAIHTRVSDAGPARASEGLRRTNPRESGERFLWGFGVAAALAGERFPKIVGS
jgi:hypothetical protein